MIILFLANLIWSGMPDTYPQLTNMPKESVELLKTSFQGCEDLLSACLENNHSTKVGALVETWMKATKLWNAGLSQTSQGYSESSNLELLWVFSCLPDDMRSEWIIQFDKFYETVRHITNTSPSFLMICVLLEGNTAGTFARLTKVIMACASRSPRQFLAQFQNSDNGLPRAHALMQITNLETKRKFMIAYLQLLTEIRAKQFDQPE